MAPILRRISEAGGDARAVMRELRLPDDAFDAPEVVVPLEVQERLYARAAEVCGDENFGLHLASNFPRGAYGLVEFIARNSPTLREGFERIVRYASIMNDGVKVSFTEKHGVARLEHRLPGQRHGYGRHGNEFFVPALLLQAAGLAGKPLTPLKVWFAHPAPRDLTPHRALLGTRKISFDAGSNGFELTSAQASLPIPGADLPLLRTLKEHAERVLPGSAPKTSLSERVRAELQARLDTSPGVASIAARLHMSPRTLQRHLADEGVTFAEVMDEVRSALAKELLVDPQVGLSEVSFRLGYSELPAFLRAFKRWTGKTPSAWREK